MDLLNMRQLLQHHTCSFDLQQHEEPMLKPTRAGLNKYFPA